MVDIKYSYGGGLLDDGSDEYKALAAAVTKLLDQRGVRVKKGSMDISKLHTPDFYNVVYQRFDDGINAFVADAGIFNFKYKETNKAGCDSIW